MEWLGRIIDEGVKLLLVVKELDGDIDADTIEFRKTSCNFCPHMDKSKIKCNICTCRLNVKWKSKTNYSTKTGKVEITHCPKGFWNDLHIAKIYNKKL